MEIILLEDVQGLGTQYKTVKVKAGYGRNYLIPQKMAVIANRRNKAIIGEKIKWAGAESERLRQRIREIIAKISEATITVGAKVGTTEKIFGSVTNVQLADAIRKATNETIDRRKITILDEVKTLGTFKAQIYFSEETKHEMEFEVVAE